MTISVTYANSRLRGFHQHLINNPPEGVNYVFSKGNEPHYIEIKPKYLNIPTKLFHSRIADYLGIIIAENEPQEFKGDLVKSYNRFVNSKTPYIIYLENPTALFHYEPLRSRTFLGRLRLSRLSSNPALKEIVCMSDSCLKTLRDINPYLAESTSTCRIYPYVPDNPFVSVEKIKKRSQIEKLKCLFVSSDFVLKGGREIVEAIKSTAFQDSIDITFVTKADSIPSSYLKIINESTNLHLLDFSLPYEELTKLYASSNVLLHPTFKDSFGLVVLEAIKAGLVVISTNLYAIPEMVENEVNGFLIDPPVYYFTPDGFPNEEIWRNQSLLIDENPNTKIIDFISSALYQLISKSKKLMDMSINSYEISKNEDFGCDYIKKSWLAIYHKINAKVDN